VERSFDLVQQLADVVEAEPGAEFAKISRRHPKRPAPSGLARRSQSAAERFVHGFPERPVRLFRLRAQLRGHILVESQRRPHIMMLDVSHQDVNVGVLLGSTAAVNPPRLSTQAGLRID
jgi:hypothetical protein